MTPYYKDIIDIVSQVTGVMPGKIRRAPRGGFKRAPLRTKEESAASLLALLALGEYFANPKTRAATLLGYQSTTYSGMLARANRMFHRSPAFREAATKIHHAASAAFPKPTNPDDP